MASNRSKGAGKTAPAPAPVAVAQTQVEKVELTQTLPPAPVVSAPAEAAAPVTETALVETATQEEAQAMIESGEATIPAAAVVDKKVVKSKARKSLNVRTIAEGFYGNVRRYPNRPGSEFTLTHERHFSANWMEWID